VKYWSLLSPVNECFNRKVSLFMLRAPFCWQFYQIKKKERRKRILLRYVEFGSIKDRSFLHYWWKVGRSGGGDWLTGYVVGVENETRQTGYETAVGRWRAIIDRRYSTVRDVWAWLCYLTVARCVQYVGTAQLFCNIFLVWWKEGW